MDITGKWHNDLKSTLEITQVANGQIVGTYTTGASAGQCAQGTFVLSGVTDTDAGGQALAFMVLWKNSQSDCHTVTAWSGQAQNVDGEDRLSCMWLLTVDSSALSGWYATHVGEDIFRRGPAPAVSAQKLTMLRRSHP